MNMALLPDYLSSLADLEAYPETLIDDITGAYDADILEASALLNAEKDSQLATAMALNAQLQEQNASLIAMVGASDPEPNDESNDEPEESTDEERGENITLDDLMEED